MEQEKVDNILAIWDAYQGDFRDLCLEAGFTDEEVDWFLMDDNSPINQS